MRIKEVREQRGLKQTDVLAKFTDKRITAPIYSNIENGVVNPTVETFKELCNALNAKGDELYEPSELNYKLKELRRGGSSGRRVTVRLPNELKDLSLYASKYGYDTVTAFVVAAIKQYIKNKEK